MMVYQWKVQCVVIANEQAFAMALNDELDALERSGFEIYQVSINANGCKSAIVIARKCSLPPLEEFDRPPSPAPATMQPDGGTHG